VNAKPGAFDIPPATGYVDRTRKESDMAVDGTWKLVVNTPMGPQESTLNLTSSGGTLTGTQVAPNGGSATIEEGTVDGNEVSWKASISKPMAMTLQFSGTVEGDTISGKVKLGMFGSSGFSGTRA
jgi:hypothetical protein